MNIDNLTYGELRAIAALFATTPTPAPANPAIGKFCVIRCGDAGVHAGTVTAIQGDTVQLSNSRRLWEWTAQGGIALSGVAQFGVKKAGTKLDATNPSITLRGWCEIIPCTVEAAASIQNG